MASHNVNLGLGYASGMFFHAPAGTALPAYPTETLAAAWEDVGDISADGVNWTPLGDMQSIRNWANEVVRRWSNTPGTANAAVIDTTEEVFNTIFGEDNVTVTAAAATHGKLVSVDIDRYNLSGAEAFLFIGKDGDDAFMLGTTSGIITNIGDVSFQPGSVISWTPTIEGNWTYLKDDGQTV